MIAIARVCAASLFLCSAVTGALAADPAPCGNVLPLVAPCVFNGIYVTNQADLKALSEDAVRIAADLAAAATGK